MTYNMRPGFYVIAIILVAALGISILPWTHAPESIFTAPKVAFTVGFMGIAGASAWVLFDKKLTMEKGHFWKIFSAYFISVLSVAGAVCFHVYIDATKEGVNPEYLMGLRYMTAFMVVLSLTIAFVVGGLFAAVLTIDEESEGWMSCMKPMKPYRDASVMPK